MSIGPGSFAGILYSGIAELVKWKPGAVRGHLCYHIRISCLGTKSTRMVIELRDGEGLSPNNIVCIPESYIVLSQFVLGFCAT